MRLAHTLRVPEVEMKKMDMSSIQLNDGSGDYLAVPIVAILPMYLLKLIQNIITDVS